VVARTGVKIEFQAAVSGNKFRERSYRLAPVAAIFDGHFLEAVLGDEDGEHLLFDVVLTIVLIAAIGTGTRLEWSA
jgi:hypothetical protein